LQRYVINQNGMCPKLNKDESLEDFENLPAPDVLAREIAGNLKSVLEQFNGINENLKEE